MTAIFHDPTTSEEMAQRFAEVVRSQAEELRVEGTVVHIRFKDMTRWVAVTVNLGERPS